MTIDRQWCVTVGYFNVRWCVSYACRAGQWCLVLGPLPHPSPPPHSHWLLRYQGARLPHQWCVTIPMLHTLLADTNS